MGTTRASTDRARGFGRIGIWSMESRFGDPAQAAATAAEIEALGYGALWIPGGVGGDVLGHISSLIPATSKLKFATAILNIYRQDADYVASWWQAQQPAVLDRVLLGIGVSHAPLIREYRKPLQAMREYLDQLAQKGVPGESCCLAALGPKMLELARDRTAGAHPYLVTPEHARRARAILGADAFLAPELGVILETDADKARAIAADAVSGYMKLPNYVNNWRRLGFTESDVTGPTHHLLDNLYAWGSVQDIAARVQEFLDAGADHVCLQVLHEGSKTMTTPIEQYRALAKGLKF